MYRTPGDPIGQLDEFDLVTALLENGLDHTVDVSLSSHAASTESDYFHGEVLPCELEIDPAISVLIGIACCRAVRGYRLLITLRP